MMISPTALISSIDSGCFDNYDDLSNSSYISHMGDIRAVGEIIIVVEAAAVDGRDKSCW